MHWPLSLLIPRLHAYGMPACLAGCVSSAGFSTSIGSTPGPAFIVRLFLSLLHAHDAGPRQRIVLISSSPAQLQGWFGERLAVCLAQICALITYGNISLGAILSYLMVSDFILLA